MEETTTYLLLGGGPASVWAAQAIRERDKEGSMTIVTNEAHPPYDKPPLSKKYIAEDGVPTDDAYSKFDSFYPDNGIALRTRSAAVGIDRGRRTVTLENGDTLCYEKLLLALGAEPRTLDIPGSSLPGIFTLRTIENAQAIAAAARNSRRAVLVGAGYLNMEVASGLLQRGLDVTIVEQGSGPWARLASPTLARFLADAYTARGAKFLFGQSVIAFEGEGRVESVSTTGGSRLPADMVVVAVGAALRTELARDAGLEVDPREGVVVDEYLQTSDPSIWAAGDIACFNDIAIGRRWHVEHHLNAKWQSRAVGAIMAGERKPYNQVPYLFSDFLDLHMVLRGDPVGSHAAQTRVLGDLARGEFVELYAADNGVLKMGLAISHDESRLDPISDKLEELVRARALAAEVTESSLGV